MMEAGERGRRNGQLVNKGYRIWNDEKLLVMDGGEDHTTLWI
jgi:hypothetical protein